MDGWKVLNRSPPQSRERREGLDSDNDGKDEALAHLSPRLQHPLTKPLHIVYVSDVGDD